jgi:anti-sigma-K factor RskA
MPPLPKGIEAKMFGVTVEDEGGSQTPTMPIIMAGN